MEWRRKCEQAVTKRRRGDDEDKQRRSGNGDEGETAAQAGVEDREPVIICRRPGLNPG